MERITMNEHARVGWSTSSPRDPMSSSPSSPPDFLFPHSSIYRKPSYSSVLIHDDSFHYVSHKLAAFHSMIHRLLSIPLSPASFESERNTIAHLAHKNHNDINIKIIQRKLPRSTFDRTIFGLVFRKQNIFKASGATAVK